MAGLTRSGPSYKRLMALLREMMTSQKAQLYSEAMRTIHTIASPTRYRLHIVTNRMKLWGKCGIASTGSALYRAQ